MSRRSKPQRLDNLCVKYSCVTEMSTSSMLNFPKWEMNIHIKKHKILLESQMYAWENTLFKPETIINYCLKVIFSPDISHHLSSLECGWDGSAHPSSHQSDGRSSWRGTGWWGPGLCWYRRAALSWILQRQIKMQIKTNLFELQLYFTNTAVGHHCTLVHYCTS